MAIANYKEIESLELRAKHKKSFYKAKDNFNLTSISISQQEDYLK